MAQRAMRVRPRLAAAACASCGRCVEVCPQGVFELRYFFSESVNGPEGGNTSLLILKRRVKTGEVLGEELLDRGVDLHLVVVLGERVPLVVHDEVFDRYVAPLELALRLGDKAGIERDRFIERLFDAGIGCSVHYIPLHLHPYWRERYGLSPDEFPHSQHAYERMLSLPLYSKMSDAEVERVIARLTSLVSALERGRGNPKLIAPMSPGPVRPSARWISTVTDEMP